MTRTDIFVMATFGACTLGAVSYGGQCIGFEQWDRAIVVYLAAALCLAALVREIHRTVLPGDYTDDIPDQADDQDTIGVRYTLPRPRSRTRRMGRLRASRTARREASPDGCTCELWWTSLGRTHTPACPATRRSSV